MGQGQLPAAGIALSLVCSAWAAAQGPLYRERWADLHLELLRERVLRESAARDSGLLAAVAADLAGDDGGIPFLPPARALARLRGAACDDAFLLRALVAAFVLPEVVDPVGDQEACRQLALSLFLPYSTKLPGTVSFAVEVFDAGGQRVFAGAVDTDTDLDDLRMARPHVVVPGPQLADGTYRVAVRTLLDGNEPRPHDPVLEHHFAVLRGYQARAEGARADAERLLPRCAGTSRALLLGCLLEVNRAYAGEAFEGSSDAVADLWRLELAVANVAAGRPVLAGMTGLVPTALPSGGEAVVSAVLPTGELPRRPLLVICGMAPANDVRARRPLAPAARGARWVQRRVGDLGLGDTCHVVWLQSPGGGLPYARALPDALAALRELVPNDGRTVLVLELDAAMAASFAGDLLAREAIAAVLVGAGTFSAQSLAALGGMPLLGVPLDGHPSSAGLQRTADVVAGRFGPPPEPAHFELARALPRPWTFGAAAAKADIAAFVRRVLRTR